MSQKAAYEISSLLSPSGEAGEKSGIYRLLYQKIIRTSEKGEVFLFTIYPDLLDTIKNNQDILTLLKSSNIKFIQAPIYCIPLHTDSISFFIRKTVRFFYRKIKGNQWMQDYQNMLLREFKEQKITKIYHGESTYFPVQGFINSITINDLVPIKLPHLCQKKTIEDAKKRLSFAKEYADEIICISENTKKDLLEYWGTSVKNKHIEVVYPSTNPLPTTHFPSTTNYQSLVTHRYFLAYGTYEPRKNLIMLCNLFIKLEKEHKLNGYKLVLAGGKGWGGVWEEIAKLKDPIVQLGFVNDADLANLIKNAKAVLYPTLYEGYGFPVVESRELGTPVFCSNNSSLPEVCKENCTLVEEGEWEKIIMSQTVH